MRTALPAPDLLRTARALASCRRRNDLPPRGFACTPHSRIDHFAAPTILEARTDPNAFAEYIARRGPDPAWPSLHSAWRAHFAKVPDELVLAPVGAGMSRQLSSWRTYLDALWLAHHLAANPGARVSIVTADEHGADALIAATKRAWAGLERQE